MSAGEGMGPVPSRRRWRRRIASLGIGLLLGLAISALLVFLNWSLIPPGDRILLSELVLSKTQQLLFTAWLGFAVGCNPDNIRHHPPPFVSRARGYPRVMR